MTVTIRVGHVLTELGKMPEKSVHCVVCSPPYMGLRSYNTPPQTWGGDGSCGDGGHDWRDNGRSGQRIRNGQGASTIPLRAGNKDDRSPHADATVMLNPSQGDTCRRCHAWRGELGQEPTLDCLGWATGTPCGACYVCHITEVFRAVKRVLRDDGCLFLNLGDGFNSGSQFNGHKAKDGTRSPILKQTDPYSERAESWPGHRKGVPGLKPKDLMGVPWRVAFALQADGYYLRNDLIWAKTACMPESVGDRATRSHEFIFHFSKKATYFYDNIAVQESATSTDRVCFGDRAIPFAGDTSTHKQPYSTGATGYGTNGTGRNQRTVWTIGPEPFPGSHFAVMPTEIPRRAILAGTSAKGCCATCGAPWRRVVEHGRLIKVNGGGAESREDKPTPHLGGRKAAPSHAYEHLTTGWSPTCTHDAPCVPATVLDPFAGSGTTGLVADRLGRDAVLIELSESYAQMAAARIRGDAPLFVALEVS